MSYASAVEPLRAANALAGKPLYRWAHLSVDGRPRARVGRARRSRPTSTGPKRASLDQLFVCAGGNPAAFDHKPTFGRLRKLAAAACRSAACRAAPYPGARGPAGAAALHDPLGAWPCPHRGVSRPAARAHALCVRRRPRDLRRRPRRLRHDGRPDRPRGMAPRSRWPSANGICGRRRARAKSPSACRCANAPRVANAESAEGPGADGGADRNPVCARGAGGGGGRHGAAAGAAVRRPSAADPSRSVYLGLRLERGRKLLRQTSLPWSRSPWPAALPPAAISRGSTRRALA